MNEDYVKGMRLLLREAKIQRINIRKCTWIPNVSKMLSEHDLCYKFWYNVVKQKKLNRVFLCKTWYDIMYELNKRLFLWVDTEEGIDFWRNHLWGMLGLGIPEDFDFIKKLKDMRLW